MSKKLVYNYTFNPGAPGVGNIIVHGYYPLKTILLITNVTDSQILFSFADPLYSADISYSDATDETTITFTTYDTSSMDASDQIQIFIDEQESKIDFSETFVDPVSKLRVSNPQNLIDTDFEYGLQPTKWETIELVNNIPSFFSRDSEYTIPNITSITAINKFPTITVNTSTAHNLSVGVPIDVQGVTSPTAEGKFLITSIPSSTSFTYVAKENQILEENNINIYTSYSTIRTGEFFVGSDIKFKSDEGIKSDNRVNSTLSFETEYDHGFTPGTNFYVTNTVGSKQYDLSYVTNDIAIDDRPNVDFEDEVISSDKVIDKTQTETKKMTGTYALKFDGSSVNVSNNTITWPNHKLRPGDVLLYVPSSGDTQIGGLERFQIYYVKSTPSNDTITLCNTDTSSTDPATNAAIPIINFTSAGTYNYGRHQLILGYEYYYLRVWYSAWNGLIPRHAGYGNGSGWDRRSSSQYYPHGLSGRLAQRCKWVFKNYGLNDSWTGNRSVYATNRNGNYTLGKTSTTPDGYDFIEDFARFDLPHPNNSATSSSEPNYTWDDTFRYFYRYFWYNYRNTAPGPGYIYTFDLDFDSEADSIYIQNHGITVGTASTAYFEKVGGGNASTRTEILTSESQGITVSTVTGSFSSSLTAISPDRVRIDSLSRLRSFEGDYNITIYRDNGFKDTFFIPSLGNLDDNTTLFIETEGSAALPTTQPGPITPEKTNVQAVYNATIRAMDTIRETMVSNNVATLLAYNNNTEAYPFVNSDITVDGGTQRIGYQRYQMYVDSYDVTGSFLAKRTISKNFSSLSDWATGQYIDPFDTTDLANKGFYFVSSPFTGQNTTLPYFVEVHQVPYYTDSNPDAVKFINYWGNNTRNAPNTSLNSITSNDNNYNNWFDVTGSQNGLNWRYTYEASYYQPNTSRHGYIFLGLTITNLDWPGESPNPQGYLDFQSSPFLLQGNVAGQRYTVHTLIPVKNNTTVGNFGASGTIYDFQEMADIVANEIADVLTNESFEVGITTAKARVLGSNRLAIQNEDGIRYNFTGFGTASGSSIIIKTEEKTGGVDGYYQSYSTGQNNVLLATNVTISNREINFDYQNVGNLSANAIEAINHKMENNQLVVYDAVSGSIAGLESGTSYYVDAIGPNAFSLKTSVGSDSVSLGSTLSGSFKVTLNSISGISSIPGTVAISTASKVIEGTGTDFERYFKVGDTFKISNNLEAPERYLDFTVDSVISDEILTVSETPGIGITDAKVYTGTKINVRPDGTNVHRPFDGGVEITAGSSPNSSIVRQTRKYFRYQSGKGIQCSLAINFNPPRQIISMFGSQGASLQDNEEYTINVRNRNSDAFILFGEDRTGNVISDNAKITVYDIDTLKLNVYSPGHPVWIKTAPGTGIGDSVGQTWVTNNGTEDGIIEFDTTTVGVGTYYYQCQNHGPMYGEIEVVNTPSAGTNETLVKFSTLTPHGLLKGNEIKIRGAGDSTYDGVFEIIAAKDNEAYYISSTTSATSIVSSPLLEYNIQEWSNSAIRCGLFDFQNGFFFEYDGSTLYAVRRSSVLQLPIRADVTYDSHVVNWSAGAKFTNKLFENDYVVIRGTSYKITKVSENSINIQPAYRGVSDIGITITKTVDTKVPQDQWNIDKADGTGPSGFILDKTKIQMAYLDYSWYGAGKIRFGFKDTHGHVKYFHEFIHNNKLDEAYMRSGNIPGRYEITNYGGIVPSYIPSLFHWGTSVMMDGGFDDDKAYQFTATSNTLLFTNGDGETANTTSASLIYSRFFGGRRYWYLVLPIAPADAIKFSVGSELYTLDEQLNGQTVSTVRFSGSTAYVDILIGETSYNQTLDIVPSITSGTTIYIGTPPSGNSFELTTDIEIPVISIRLAPSVDNNLTGAVGVREIINRMQLQLKSLGVTLSHDCNVDLILNGSIDNKDFRTVDTPSLSELIKHNSGDRLTNGTKVFSFRASGGTEGTGGSRLPSTSDFDLSNVSDLGNSILGGDDIFPNGPDLLTIAISPIDTSTINATSPLTVSSRITWTESQA